MLRCVIDLLLTTRIHQFSSHIRALQITQSQVDPSHRGFCIVHICMFCCL